MMKEWSVDRALRAHRASLVPEPDCEQCGPDRACRECYADSMESHERRYRRHAARRAGHPSAADLPEPRLIAYVRT